MEVETAQAMGDAKRRSRSGRLTSYILLQLQVLVHMIVRSSWLKRASYPLVHSGLITVLHTAYALRYLLRLIPSYFRLALLDCCMTRGIRPSCDLSILLYRRTSR